MPTIPTIIINKGCLVITKDVNSIYFLKKECILGYEIGGDYLRIHTSIRGVGGGDYSYITLSYTGTKDFKQCEKNVHILNTILSPDVEAPADLLGL